MLARVLLNKVYLVLFLVVLLAGFLRFYKIDRVPVSLYWDEVSSSYNAYSILKTGKDEFGTPHPFLFRAFEDYKTPANIYLSAIPVSIFGLNEFSARFTSALLGTLTVLLTFFLARELIDKKFLGLDSDYIALLAAFFLSISPWHLQFSRTGFEANTGLFFVVLGALLFFRYINFRNSFALFASSAIFAISIYFYRSIWVFVPLLFLSLSFIYRKTLFAKVNRKTTIISILIFVILVAPFVPIMISKQGLVRVSQVNVIDNSTQQVNNYIAKQSHLKGGIGKVVFNRRIVYGQTILQGYARHFSSGFLFFQGDGNERHGVKGTGVLYIWGVIFLIPGLIGLLKLDKKIRNSLILWLLIAPIPAAFSVPTPHALRSLNMLPIPQILCAIGAVVIFVRLRRNYQKVIFVLLSVFTISFFFVRYSYAYYGPSANIASSVWADGYKQLTQYVFANENKYDKIVISGHFWQPYVYFLFYKKYDPYLFQTKGSKKGFDKYLFGGTSWDMNGKELGDIDLEKYAGSRNILVALSPVEYNGQKEKVDIATIIRNHNNEIVFYVVTLK